MLINRDEILSRTRLRTQIGCKMELTTKANLRGASISLCLFAAFSAIPSHGTTLQEAYQFALNSDPALQQSSSRVFNAKENISQAKAALLPTVTGQLQANWQDKSNANSNHWEAYSVNLSQPIYSPALRSAYKKVKTLDLQAKISHNQSEQSLILRTTQAYIDTMIAHSNLTNSEAQERAIKRRLDRIKAQFEVGVIAVTDVHEAKASYDNAKVNLIISEGDLQNSYEALQRLTDHTISQTDSLSTDYLAQVLSPANASFWVKKAMANNLAIKLGKTAIESASYDTAIANSQRKPSVNLQASHSRTNHSLDGSYSNNQVSVVLSMPLFNGGSLSSKVRQSVSAQNITKSEQQDNIRAVTQLTRSLVRDIQTNVLAIHARQQSIVSSKAALSAISAGFDAGTRNIVDLLQAEQAVFSAQNQYSSAKLNHIKLNFNLKYQLGTLAQDDIIALSRWLVPAK